MSGCVCGLAEIHDCHIHPEGKRTSDWQGPEADLIAAELSRVVLGGRGPERLEQRMDLFGNLARMTIAHRLVVLDIGKQLLPTVRRIAEFMQSHPTIAALAKGDQR